MRALGYKSVSTVATHIDGLIAAGYLRKRDNSARSIEVVRLSTQTISLNEHEQWLDQLATDRLGGKITTQQVQVLREAMDILGIELPGLAHDRR